MSEPEAVATQVSANEQLARFLFSSKDDFSASKNCVRRGAFEPPKNLRLSVTRASSLTEAEIWARGKDVALKRGKSLLGRATITVQQAQSCPSGSLHVIANSITGNPEHAEIVGWPEVKAQYMQVALELASVASLSLFVS